MLTKREAWPQLPVDRPLVIAGPCSAETEEQVMDTAHQLKKDHRVCIFRAGVWKPRTRPGSFEGNGAIALKWLQRVKQEVGLPVATEVANVKHVYESLRAGVDVLWIGARTTANPFAVQEIADALKGVDIQVLVKNPVNPDVGLWMGAIERLNKSGINKLGAIHRGVSQFERSAYRNKPEWQMAIRLRERMPDLLLINDPSHIAGNRQLIYGVSQMALDLNFDGLMIETHHDPQNAWSDAAQQVTPDQLAMIMTRLQVKSETPAGVELNTMEELRSSIGYIDHQILELLNFRMNVSEDIARFKQQNNMTIFQESRWNELLRDHTKKGGELGLTPKFISKIYHAIHQESIERQSQVIHEQKKEGHEPASR